MTISEDNQVESFKIHLKFGLLKRSFSIIKPRKPSNPCDAFSEDALNLIKQTYSTEVSEDTLANVKYFLCLGSNNPVMKEIKDYEDLLEENSVEIIIWPVEGLSKNQETHSFKLQSFKHPVWCSYCNEIIWNFSKRSYKCSNCKVCAHKRCAPYVVSKCKAPNKLNDSVKKRKPTEQRKAISTLIRERSSTYTSGHKQKYVSFGKPYKFSSVHTETSGAEYEDELKLNESNIFHYGKSFDKDEAKSTDTTNQYEKNLKNIKFNDGTWEGTFAHRYDRESKRYKFEYEPLSNDLKIYFTNKDVFTVNTSAASLQNIDSNELRNLSVDISKGRLIEMIKDINDGLKNTNFGKECKSTFSITSKENSALDFEDLYEIDENDVLGAGRFGKVYGGYKRDTREPVAVKKALICERNSQDSVIMKEEAKLLFSLDHPGILKCTAFFHRPTCVILVTERLQTDMLEFILRSENPKSRLTESCTKYICYQILIALRYLHRQNIAHCDLKPENVLLRSESDMIHVKIADFGYARVIRDESVRHTLVGTPAYLPPEVFNKKLRLNHGYNRSLDIWSFGVIAYVSLCGYFPYRDDRDLVDQIKTHSNLFAGEVWEEISIVAKNLIGTKLLVPNAGRRIISQSLIYHEWFTKDKKLRAALTKLEIYKGIKWLTDVLEESSEESASDE